MDITITLEEGFARELLRQLKESDKHRHTRIKKAQREVLYNEIYNKLTFEEMAQEA